VHLESEGSRVALVLAAAPTGLGADRPVTWQSSAMVPGSALTGFGPALIAALILAVIKMLLDSLRIDTQSRGGPDSSSVSRSSCRSAGLGPEAGNGGVRTVSVKPSTSF